MVPSIVHGTEPQYLRKVTTDFNDTTYLDYPDVSYDNGLDYPDVSYDNGLDMYYYNNTDSYEEFFEGDGFERHLQSQGDWTLCSSSSQCASRCCSGMYSNNVLKCTPLRSGFDPIANRCVNGGSGSGGGATSNSGNAWINAHNDRRRTYHTRYGKSYVPLKWSSSLENSARAWANNLLGSCSLIHGSSGENLAMTSWNGSPNDVLKMWVEDEDPGNGQYIFQRSGHFSQALWRGSKYLGCAIASKPGCTIHVCRYLAPGNCNISGNEGRWPQLVFADSSPCGPQCPREGCF